MTWQSALLRDNFQEIYHVVHGSKGRTLNLVADLSGRRIYDSTRGWGRLWIWFYNVVNWVMHGDMRLDKLKKAIIVTHTLFLRQLPIIQKHAAAYESYLRQAGNGYTVIENQLHAARRAIVFWNQSYGPFLKLMQSMRSPRLEKLFQVCFKSSTQPLIAATLWASPYAKQLKACQQVIDVEGMSCGPLPLEVFKKILKEKPLNAIDTKNLKRWISKINKVPESVERVHGMMRAVSERYAKDNGERQHHQAVALEAFLEDKGCSVFRQQDPKHILWQQSLKKGAVLNANGADFVLGREFLSSDSSTDNNRVFALDHPPGQVLITAQNKTALAIRSLRNQSESEFAVKPVQFLGIYGKGRWATMESFQTLGSRKWTTSNGDISAEDIPLVNTLTAMLSDMIKHNCSFSGFSSNEIMIDSQGQLRSLKTMQRQNFDFNALEDFARDCAAGNGAIFQHLMSTSGLCNHPTANFYYDLLVHAFKGEEIVVEDMAGIYKIGDPKVVDRGTALVREALALRSKLSIKIREDRPGIDLKAIKSSLSSVILSCYLSTKSYSVLWPSLNKEVLRNF